MLICCISSSIICFFELTAALKAPSLRYTHLICRLDFVAHCTGCALVGCELCLILLAVAGTGGAFARLAIQCKASWLTFVRVKLTGCFGDSTPRALAGSGRWSCSSSSCLCGPAFSAVAGSTNKMPLACKQIFYFGLTTLFALALVRTAHICSRCCHQRNR